MTVGLLCLVQLAVMLHSATDLKHTIGHLECLKGIEIHAITLLRFHGPSKSKKL